MILAARQGRCRLRLESGLCRPPLAMTDRRSFWTGVLDAWRKCNPGSLCQLFVLPSQKMARLQGLGKSP